jgi:Fe2+ transport system protein FeoA
MQLRRKRDNKEQALCQTVEGQAPLASLKEGEKATITHITGDEKVVRRLSEMGLTPGCELRLLRKGSFRGPIEVEVRGSALALGYALASEICVQPLKAP